MLTPSIIFAGTAGAVCLGVAACLHYFAPAPWARQIMWLIVGGVAAFNPTPLGAWLHKSTTWVSDQAAPFIGTYTGISVIAAGALLAVIIFAIHHHKKELNRWAFTAAFAIPVTASLAPGPLGELLASAVGTVAAVPTQIVAYAFGGA